MLAPTQNRTINAKAEVALFSVGVNTGDEELKSDGEAYMNEVGARGNLTLESEVLGALKGDINVEAIDD